MSTPNHVLVMLVISFFELEVKKQKIIREDAIARYNAEVCCESVPDLAASNLRMKNYADEWNKEDTEYYTLYNTLDVLYIIQAKR